MQSEEEFYFGSACECNNFNCPLNTEGARCSGEDVPGATFIHTPTHMYVHKLLHEHTLPCSMHTHIHTHTLILMPAPPPSNAGRGTCSCDGTCACDVSTVSNQPYTGEICECSPDTDRCINPADISQVCVCVQDEVVTVILWMYVYKRVCVVCMFMRKGMCTSMCLSTCGVCLYIRT